MPNVVEILVKGRDKFSGPAKSAQTSAGGLKGAMGGLGKMAVGVGAGFIAAQASIAGVQKIMSASIGAAMKFEHQMAQIRGLTGATREDTDLLEGSIKDMARAMPKSPAELGAGAYFIISAGITDAAEAANVLEISAKASAAGLGETKVVADAVTSALNAYKMGAGEAERMTDILTTTVRLGKTEASALAGSIGRILPVAAAMGVSFEEVGANLAVMTKVGLSADEAATSLRATMTSLLKPTSEAEDALAAMGISSEALRQQIREKGLLSTLSTLMEKTGGNTAEITKIIPNVRALTNVLGTVGSQAETYADTLDQMNRAQGATETAFGEVADTAKFKMGVAMNELNIALMELGEAILPALVAGVEALVDAARPFLWALIQVSDEEKVVAQNADAAREALGDFARAGEQGMRNVAIQAGGLEGEIGSMVARADEMKVAFEENEEAGGDFGRAMADVKGDLEALETQADDTRTALFKMFTEPTQEEKVAEAALKGYELQEQQLLEALGPATEEIKEQAKEMTEQGGNAEDAELKLRGMTDADLELYHGLHDDLIPETRDHIDLLGAERDALGATAEATYGTALSDEELRAQTGLLTDELDVLAGREAIQVTKLSELTGGAASAKGKFSALTAAQEGAITTVDTFIEHTKTARQKLIDETATVDTLIQRLGNIPSDIQTTWKFNASPAELAIIKGLKNVLVSTVPMQHGGIVTRPTLALLGERGPEAVIPLDRGGGGGRAAEMHFHFDGPILGDERQAMQFARMILPEIRRAVAT